MQIQIAVSCSPSCTGANVYVDGNYMFGTGLQNDGTITVYGLSEQALGTHTIQAVYTDTAGTTVKSPITNFSIVANHLPIPGGTVTLDPSIPIAGSPVRFSVALNCGASCGTVAPGDLLIDGSYAGFNYLDQNGAAIYTPSTDTPQLTAGVHTASFAFFGNAGYSNIILPPISFTMFPPYGQQPVGVTVTVPASPFAQGEGVAVDVSVTCSAACGGAVVLVDGSYAFGTGVQPNGTVSPRALSGAALGQHTIQALYVDLSGATVAVSPLSTFTVVPNTLPVSTGTITFNPASPVVGVGALVTVALSCGSGCEGGAGVLLLDGSYAGFNTLDSNGVAVFAPPPSGPQMAFGSHTASFAFLGNAGYSNTVLPAIDFNVSASTGKLYDAGRVTMTLNGVSESVPYSQTQNAASGALTAALASAINADPNAAVGATASGSALSLTAKSQGASTNYAYTVSQSYDTADFTQPSFTVNPANGNLAGGAGSGSGSSQVVYGYSILKTDMTSGYAANGNLLAYADAVNGVPRNWTFSYDSLNRLISGSTSTAIPGGYPFYCWNYDSFGNRLVQTGANQAFADATCQQPAAATYATTLAVYDSSNHLTTLNGAAVPAPDSVGNTIDDGMHQFLYDPDGRICAEQGATVAGITPRVQYLYDAEGRRVAKGSITTFSCDSTTNGFRLNSQYLLGPSGEQLTELDGTGAWAHTNVYAAGGMIATFENDNKGAHFHLTDWLGTRRAQTDYKGTLEATYTSLPFGDGFAPTGGPDPTEHHFTGKERDTESGLDYFGARYYSSNMGRFTSPDDPFVDQSPGDPQSWNLYTYARNNPVVNTDPTGQDCIYGDGNGGGSLLRGDCASDSDNGIFVNGTVDANSFKYNASNNSSSFSYTPDGAGPGTIGTGVIQGPNLNGGFEAGSLAAGVFGAANASKFINAAGVVNGVGGTAMTIGATIVNPALGYVVGCVSGVSGCGVGSAALALLPEVAALRSGAAILRAGRGLNAAEILQKAGGFSQALQDFEALPGKETIMGEMRTKTLLDGTKVTVRDFSKAGPPTLQLNAPSGIKTEYRY